MRCLIEWYYIRMRISIILQIVPVITEPVTLGAYGGTPASYFCSVCAQEAKRPLLVIGAGGNRKLTSKMLRRMVDQLQLPFCETQMGKGVVDSRTQQPLRVLYERASIAGCL